MKASSRNCSTALPRTAKRNDVECCVRFDAEANTEVFGFCVQCDEHSSVSARRYDILAFHALQSFINFLSFASRKAARKCALFSNIEHTMYATRVNIPI